MIYSVDRNGAAAALASIKDGVAVHRFLSARGFTIERNGDDRS